MLSTKEKEPQEVYFFILLAVFALRICVSVYTPDVHVVVSSCALDYMFRCPTPFLHNEMTFASTACYKNTVQTITTDKCRECATAPPPPPVQNAKAIT